MLTQSCKATDMRGSSPCRMNSSSAMAIARRRQSSASQRKLPSTAANALLASRAGRRSEEHTSELQSLMRISYAVFCLKKKTHKQIKYTREPSHNHAETDKSKIQKNHITKLK